MARKDFILGDNFTKKMKNNSFVQSFRRIVEDISAGSRIIQSLVPCLSDCKEPTSQTYATKLQQGEIHTNYIILLLIMVKLIIYNDNKNNLINYNYKNYNNYNIENNDNINDNRNENIENNGKNNNNNENDDDN